MLMLLQHKNFGQRDKPYRSGALKSRAGCAFPTVCPVQNFQPIAVLALSNAIGIDVAVVSLLSLVMRTDVVSTTIHPLTTPPTQMA